jgi:hypothetical protein
MDHRCIRRRRWRNFEFLLAVVVSNDPGWHSLLESLESRFKAFKKRVPSRSLAEKRPQGASAS